MTRSSNTKKYLFNDALIPSISSAMAAEIRPSLASTSAWASWRCWASMSSWWARCSETIFASRSEVSCRSWALEYVNSSLARFRASSARRRCRSCQYWTSSASLLAEEGRRAGLWPDRGAMRTPAPAAPRR